jgi:phage gp36-like protein
MSVWIRLTPADLRTRLSERELDALRRANAAFDDEAAQEVLDQTADMARGFIAAWSGNALSSVEHGVPPALKSTCLDIAAVDYQSSIAGVVLDPKGVRQKAYDRAIARLEKTAEGKFVVQQPAAGEAEASGSSAAPAAPSFYDKPTSLSRSDQRGSY